MTQTEALAILKTGANVFLTGEPGSGKTHTINEYIAWLTSCGLTPAVTAATGIAATHVGGMTLHAWSGIGVAGHLSPPEIERIAEKEHIARRIQKAHTLIIDEVSMLSPSALSLADAVCREVRHCEDPFGGLQVVLVGDFFQLPPVQKGGETRFVYDAPVWRELNPLVCYLTEQFRQDDPEYLEVLCAIRLGEVEELHHERLVSRMVPEAAAYDLPKIFAHNADVDRINQAELAKLPGKAERFSMQSKGKAVLVEGLKRGCLSPPLLELKLGAKVMCTKNSPQGKFVNGTVGTVVGFDFDRYPILELPNGARITVSPMEWQIEEGGKVRASISQVPLRLAYAITVHKSQGMSMDAAVVDLSHAFEYGQGYVALSRVRRLSGLHLLGLNKRALEVHPEISEKDKDFRDASRAAMRTFADMPRDELEALQKRFIRAIGGVWSESGGKIRSRKDKSLVGRLSETLQAVRVSTSLREAVEMRGLTASTILKHLEELAELQELKTEDFVHLAPTGQAAERIQKAIAASSGDRLKPIWEKLGGAYSFEDIRLAKLAATVHMLREMEA
jgi:ATP-dependent exoDNAse (exonuclease V) alpha subunit